LAIVPTAHTGQTQAQFASILANTASAMWSAGPVTTGIMNNNDGLAVRVATGNPTSGHANSTLRVRVYYRIIPFPF
jgi:hypothetical protein